MVVKHAFEYKGDLTYDGKPIEEQHTVNRKCSLKEPCSIQFLILKSKTKQVSLVEVDNSLTRLSERSERNIVNMFDLTTEKLMAVIDNLPFNELLRIGEKVCRDNPEWKSIFPQESIFDQIENINPACTDNPLSSYLDQKAGESTNRYNDSYGWLSDKGKFYQCKWNELEKWADRRLESYYGDKTGPNIPGAVWLITVERWIAITSPYHGIPWHRYDASQPMKPAQIEFLCKFYREHDRKDTADELAAMLTL